MTLFSRTLSGIRATPRFLWRHKIATIVTTLIALPVIGIVAFALSPTQPEYVTDVAKRGDLRQTVEAVGTVISDRDLNLQFGISGIVSNVYVKEGDKVRAGQKLAQLRAGGMGADIASAQARVAQAEADLREMEAGARPEDLAVTEAEVANKRASLAAAKESLRTSEDAVETGERQLELLKSEVNTALAGYVSTTKAAVTQKLATAQSSLAAIDGVFNNNDLLDAVIKNNPSGFNDLRAAIQNAQKDINQLYGVAASAQTPSETLGMVDRATVAITNASTAATRAYTFVSSLQESSSFSSTDREAYKSQLSTERDAIQAAVSSLASETKALRDAGASYVSQIAAQEAQVTAAKGSRDRAVADIATFEASLRISEAQLALKKAPARETDIASARAILNQYRAALARTSADFGNTVIVAPVSGTVTKVPIKVGEFTPAGPAISMLGEAPYRIEMYVSEIDVTKIQLNQSGSVKLDAFPGEFFTLKVSQLDDSSTDRDGVSKYRVRLDFLDQVESQRVKLGMTGDAMVITGFSKDVIYVPIRAVLEQDDGSEYVRVLKDDGTIEERVVQTGMEGEASTIEVLGVEEGETVVVLIKE
jgi:RND family efflux transporter MFP subunit